MNPANVIVSFHFSTQANIAQDTYDAFTLGLGAEIDRGTTVMIHDPLKLVGLVAGAAERQH